MYSTKKSSGSALVYSLVILSVVMVMALGVASVSIVERRNATGTGKSVQAFQVADSAVEKVLKQAAENPGMTLTELASVLSGSCDVPDQVALINFDVAGGSAQLMFNFEGSPVNECSKMLTEVDEVKSVGTFANTNRAINAAVAATRLVWTDVTFANGWSNAASFQGVQYAKDSRTGIVYLRGVAYKSPPVASEKIFTLPAGYRPNPASGVLTFSTWFLDVSSDPDKYGIGRVDINTSGDVSFAANVAAGLIRPTTFSLNGIFFDGE